MSKDNKKQVKMTFPEWWYRKVLSHADRSDWISNGDMVIYEGEIFYSQEWILREKKYIKKLFLLGYKPEDVIKLFDKAQRENDIEDEVGYCDFFSIYKQELKSFDK